MTRRKKDSTPTPGEEKLAASYARKSNDDQDGVDHQHAITAQSAERDGYRIPQNTSFRFGDNDRTGANSDREDFERLVSVVTSGRAPFTRLYVKDKTRFGRWDDPRMHGYYEVLFLRHGVEIRYCNTPHAVDYSRGITGADVGWSVKNHLDDLQSAQERRTLIERTTTGRRQCAIDGSYPGKRAPYAAERWYQSRESGRWLEPVPPLAGGRREGTSIKLRWVDGSPFRVVQQIFDLLERGESLKGVVRRLERDGVPTPSGDPTKRWAPEMVRKIASNRIYCGDLVWGRSTRQGTPVLYRDADPKGAEPILYPGFAPGAPISPEQFARVQAILAGNREHWDRRRATSPLYLLSGLVKCAACGATLHGHSGPARADGDRPRFYRHPPAPRQPQADTSPACRNAGRYVRATPVEDALVNVARELLHDQQLERLVRAAIEDRLGQESTVAAQLEIEALMEGIRKLERLSDRAAQLAAEAESETELARYQNVVRSHSREIEFRTERITQLRAEQSKLDDLTEAGARISDRASNLAEAFSAASVADRKEVIADLVHHVDVDPDADDLFVVVRVPPA